MIKAGISKAVFLGFVLLLISSCNGNKTKMISRAWKIKGLKYTEAVPPEMQSTVDTWVHMMEDSFTLIYNADGTYISQLGRNNLKGKWSLNMTGSTIVSTSPEGVKTDFKIVELSDEAFNFEANQNGSKVIFEMVPQ